ncbi:hypothetical protein [Aquimarina pacifica]|uniref:hypothetical protein n=1 Tax=Aquimarina pacifica TaxID=1296415 RepID=UPI00046F42FE|nr:hypothetical protein [Aquimarina pacifica]
MKSTNINTILQIVGLVFLIIIGYMTFSSGSKWESIQKDLDNVRNELKTSRDTLKITQTRLKSSLEEIEKMNLQKDIFKRERDSIILDFKKETAADWDALVAIKDSIKENQEKLIAERVLLDSLFNIKK